MRQLLVAVLAVLVGMVGMAGSASAEIEAMSPGEGAEVQLRRPPIVFSGALPPDVSRDDILILLDGTDLTEFATWKKAELRVVPPLPMAEGEHRAEVRQVNLPDREPLASVTFRIVPPGRAFRRDGRFKDSLTLAVDRDRDDKISVAPHIDGAFKGARSEIGYDVTVAHTFALQGRSRDLKDPDMVFSFARSGWKGEVGRIGRATNFRDSKFVGIKTYRRAAQLGFGQKAAWTLFSNSADALPTVTGERSFEQWIQGTSLRLPFGGDRVEVTLLGLLVRDREGRDESRFATSSPEEATIFGALLHFDLAEDWRLDAEVSTSDREVHEGSASIGERDEALQVELRGKFAKHDLKAGFTRVGSRYANPADPGLWNDREEANLKLSRREKRWNYELRLSSGEDGLDGGVDSSDELRYGFGVGGELPHGVKAALKWDRQEVDSAGNDSAQNRTDLSLSRRWKALQITLRGGRTETERPDQGRDSVQRTFKLSGRWTGPGSWALNGAAGMTRRDDSGVATDSEDIFLEPSWKMAADRLRFSLNLGFSRRQTPGRTDSQRLTGRSSLSWKIPGRQGLTLSLDTTWSRARDGIGAMRRTDQSASFKLTYSPKTTFGGN